MNRADPRPAHPGGYALLLALIAIAITAIVSMGVLQALAPTTAMASNAHRGASARAVAEAGVDAVQAYLDDFPNNWHTQGGPNKAEGWWFTDQPLAGGTYSVFATRADGDGAVTNESFNNADAVRVSVHGTLNGYTAVVTRTLNAAQPQPEGPRVLFVLHNQSQPDAGSQDAIKAQLMRGWGFRVSYISSRASQSSFNDAVEEADVIYITENVLSGDVNTKVRHVTIGVVNEETQLYDDFEFSNAGGVTWGTTINITDNTHDITSGFAVGPLAITSAGTDLSFLGSTLTAGARVLAERPFSADPTLFYFDAGARDRTNAVVPGRRVNLPWGGDGFDVNLLTAAGLEIMRRAIEWAALDEDRFRVLMITDSTTLDSHEQRHRNYMLGWGMAVTALPASTSQAELLEAALAHDVVFVDALNSGTLGTKLVGTPVGVVVGDSNYYDEFGFCSETRNWPNMDLTISNVSHPITDEFSLGDVRMQTASRNWTTPNGSRSPDLLTLAHIPGQSGHPALAVLEVGARRFNAGFVAGRRVKLPWGNSSFDTALLEPAAFNMLKASLEWAGEEVTGLTTNWYNLASSPSRLSDVNWSSVTATSIETRINWPSTSNAWRAGIQADRFAVELTGEVTAPATGTWTFFLESDDGSELVVNGNVVVDNDYTHAMQERSGTVAMTEGQPLPLRVRFFEDTGGAGLILRWQGPGTGKQVVPPSAFGVEDTGLLAAWALDETSGSTAVDAINGINGTNFNGVILAAAGRVGTAFAYDGTNDHTEIPHDDRFLLDAGTVAFWLRPDTTDRFHQGVFSKDSNGTDTGGHLHISMNHRQIQVRLQSNTSDYHLSSSTNALAAGTWAHVAFTFGTQGARLYLNGNLVDTNSYTGGLGASSGNVGNREPLVLGASTRESGDLTKSPLNGYFDGRLDEVLIYNRQLDASEISALANP